MKNYLFDVTSKNHVLSTFLYESPIEGIERRYVSKFDVTRPTIHSLWLEIYKQ